MILTNLSPLYDGGRDHPFSQTIIHVLTKANMKMIIWQSWQGLMNPNLSYIQMISTFTFRAKNSSPLQKHGLFLLEKKLATTRNCINPHQVYDSFCALLHPLSPASHLYHLVSLMNPLRGVCKLLRWTRMISMLISHQALSALPWKPQES